MNDSVLLPWIYAFLISYVLIAPFVAWLRPKVLTLVFAGTALAGAALVIELVVQGLLDPVYAAVIVLVLVGPFTEELLKFFLSGATGANFASAAGAGIGFAATENALYFWAAWGSPLDSLLALILIRAATDPLLHSTSTTLSTLTWRGRWWGLPAALLLHMSWNFATLVYVAVSPTAGLALLASASLAVLAIMLLLRRNPEVQEDLDNRTVLHPLTGEVSAIG